jgi:hypothetical protein
MYLSLVQYPVALTAAHAHKQRLLTLSMRAGLGGIKTGTRFICTYGGQWSLAKPMKKHRNTVQFWSKDVVLNNPHTEQMQLLAAMPCPHFPYAATITHQKPHFIAHHNGETCYNIWMWAPNWWFGGLHVTYALLVCNMLRIVLTRKVRWLIIMTHVQIMVLLEALLQLVTTKYNQTFNI